MYDFIFLLLVIFLFILIILGFLCKKLIPKLAGTYFILCLGITISNYLKYTSDSINSPIAVLPVCIWLVFTLLSFLLYIGKVTEII